MKRHIILISNPHRCPDDPNANYQADNVIKSYVSFFTRPEAGWWSESCEITVHYGNDKYSKNDLLSEIDYLNSLDFSILVLCGHGASIDQEDVFGLPGANEIVSIKEILSHMNSNTKSLIIIDSCRSFCHVPEDDTASEISETYDSDISSYCKACRKFYNQIILSADAHVELYQSTGPGESAYFTDNGMQYSDILITFLNSYAKDLPKQLNGKNESEGQIPFENIHDYTTKIINTVKFPQNPTKFSTNSSFSFPAVAIKF